MRRRRVVLITAKWAFTALAALVVVAHVTSQWRPFEWVQRDSKGGSTRISVSRGAVWVQVSDKDLTGAKGLRILPAGWALWFNSPSATWHYGVLMDRTISSYRQDQAGTHITYTIGTVAVTLLYPFVLFAAPAELLWWIDQRTRRRARRGLCNECGYDHSGLPQGAKCPECGTKRS
jgi:hypothetical protein